MEAAAVTGRAHLQPLAHCSDAELMQLLQSGNQRVFTELYRRYHDLMSHLIFKLVRLENDREDVLQNGWMNVIRHCKTFRFRSTVSTWLYRVFYNQAMMYLREGRTLARCMTASLEGIRAARHNRHALDEDGMSAREGYMTILCDHADGPEKQLEQRELVVMLERAIARLPRDFQDALMARLSDEHHQVQAERLGLSVSQFKSRVQRARVIMRASMKEYLKSGELNGLARPLRWKRRRPKQQTQAEP